MHIIPATEYIPTFSGQDKGGKEDYTSHKPHSKRSIYDGIVAYDMAYSTGLFSLLRDANPSGAYDHIKNSGLYDETVKIDGYILVYSWLHKELSTTDARMVQKNLREKMRGLLEMFAPDNATKYQALSEQLEIEISAWFQTRMTEARYHQIGAGLPIPTGYASLAARTPEGSLLRAKLSTIIETPIEEME